jgi:ubiquinone/menaquinone biosynthesis C-methylase UbiE
MGIYEKYAEVYDSSGQIGFSLKMIPYLQELQGRHPVGGNTMIDVACGSGTVAISFSRDGWDVWGVDRSSSMLAQAEQKARDADVSVRWSCQDMRHFVLPARVSLATCLYDSMNYMLSTREVQAALKRVAAHLAPAGLFFFDMNTAWALEHVWGDRTYCIDDDDLCVIMDSEYNSRWAMARVKVTGFVRRGRLYEKFTEVHVEQAYTQDQIRDAIESAGLRTVACYDCFTLDPATDDCSRIMWIAARDEDETA